MDEGQQLDFSKIEALMYSIIILAAKAPTQFSTATGVVVEGAAGDEAKATVFQKRILRLHANTQTYVKSLKAAEKELPAHGASPDKKRTVPGATVTQVLP